MILANTSRIQFTLTGVTRKHAVDLLEHFDTRKVTIRVDNERVLRQTPA